MQKTGTRRRKAEVARQDCVACGCCVKVCPNAAIRVVKGVCAAVDQERCVGCGRCARECPASVITVMEMSE